jgi:DNA-binding Lrp family transcriptional regulator
MRGGVDMKLDKNDFIVLSHFRNDARCRLTTMSRKTGIPVSTLFDKLQGYEGTIVRKMSSILNFEALGFRTRANILIRSNNTMLHSHLTTHPAVNSLFQVTNGYDYLAEAVFRDLRALQQFIGELEKKYRAKTEVYYVVEDLKRESFLEDASLVDVVASAS